MDKYAIIDIGTRAGRMLIVRSTNDGSYNILCKMSEVLSVGLSISNNIIDSNSKHIVKLKSFLKKAMQKIKEYNICEKNTLVIGTEVFRQAHNLKFVLQDIYIETQASIKVLSPEEEANFALLSSMQTVKISNNSNNLIIDIGGGSTEIILITYMDEEIIYKDWISIKLGIILPKIYGNAKYLSNHIRNMIYYQINDFYIRNLGRYPVNIIGVASSMYNIAAKITKNKFIPFDRRFSREEILNKTNEIHKKVTNTQIQSVNDIINIRSISISQTIMNIFEFNNAYISSNGLVYGIVKHMISQNEA